jgi:hypothetical protein
MSLASAVLLLLFAPWCVAQSSSPSAQQTVTASIEDADSGQPLSNASVKVQLFPPEHGARKLLSLLCVPSNDAQPLFSFDVATDPNGGFNLTVQGGDYLAKITIPKREPIFGCIFFDTDASVRSCRVDSSMRIRQHLFIRTATSIPGFSGDILTNSACAALAPSACDPLRVPNLVTTQQVRLIDPESEPIRNARLEFSEYTKGKGKHIASLATDTSGIGHVSSLSGLLRMSITSERASGEFLIDFAKDGKQPGQQTIKMFHWRCRGSIMQGAMVQP